MYVTKTIEAQFPVPTFRNGTWVEVIEDVEVDDFLHGIRLKEIGTRGQIVSATAVAIIARGIPTPWEYGVRFQGEERVMSGVSEHYLKSVPWLVQLALAAIDEEA